MVDLYDIIILYYDKTYFCLLVCSKSQSTIFQYVETNCCRLWLTQYLAEDKVSCSQMEHSDSTDGASQTSNPSIPNLMLYQLSLLLKDNWTLCHDNIWITILKFNFSEKKDVSMIKLLLLYMLQL